VSYAESQNRLTVPAVRAVATTVPRTRLQLPSRQVVRSNGDLSGYRWGIERKRALLERSIELNVTPLGGEFVLVEQRPG